MFDMLIYFSYPYAIGHRDSQRMAIIGLSRAIASYVKENKDSYAVNALYNEYGDRVAMEDAVYQQAGTLIRAATALVVIRASGWEYSNIVTQEIIYASSINRPILYINPV
jgi:hypothetical protein